MLHSLPHFPYTAQPPATKVTLTSPHATESASHSVRVLLYTPAPTRSALWRAAWLTALKSLWHGLQRTHMRLFEYRHTSMIQPSRTVFESVFIYSLNYFAVANCRHVIKSTNHQTRKPPNQHFVANRTNHRTPHPD